MKEKPASYTAEQLQAEWQEFIDFYGYEPGNTPQEIVDFRNFRLLNDDSVIYDEVPEKWHEFPPSQR
ncbi:MAG: hypothetical protein FWG63_01575 [Defluviitaleaceae bacterium]|nr:hypothetical protein [Defluviitaleaceae bacterium]